MSAGRKVQYLHLKKPGKKPEKVALGQELKSGGAGAIYSIQGNPDLVIKIYHEDTLNREGESYREKIECMLVNAPNVPDVQIENGRVVQLAWPVATAYTLKGDFFGFAMPTVDFQRTLELEYALTEKDATKYGFRYDLGARILLAHNLASVVSSVHAQGHAIVDLKPSNTKFYKEELFVAVLDCDGFFINVPGKVGRAPQVTADYLAPEFQVDLVVKNPEHQDRFALAVIIFQLLNYSIHPFGGIPGPNENIPAGKEACIRDGLYPYGNSPHKKVSPVRGSVHSAFPQELRELFDRAFSMRPALRPSSADWTFALKKYADKSKQLLGHCSSGHLQFSGMPCLSCLREQILSSAASANRTAQISSNASFSAPAPRSVPAPQPQVAARQPQVLTASSGNLQQVASPAQQTQSQAPAQSSQPAKHAAGTSFAQIKKGAIALILIAGMLWYFADMVRGYFAGHQPDPVVVEQPVNAKQESPQDTTSQPDALPVTITDAPVFDPPIPDRETANRGGSDSVSAASPSNRQSSMNMPEVQGWLGVETRPQVLELVSPIGINSMHRGMIINNIVKGGPADMAGMIVDDLLVAVDNKAVDTDDATRNVVSNIPVGRVVPIKIIRDGREMYLLLTITQRPQP